MNWDESLSRAKKTIKEAEEELEKWKEQNPNFNLTDPRFQYLQKEVERNSDIYKELVKKIPAFDSERVLNDAESSSAFQGIGQQSTKSNQNPVKFSAGPVDPKTTYSIPFDALPWGKSLINAVDDNQAVLLHGHWQSGKTSALHFIKTRAEERRIKVYYLDMMASTSTLEKYLRNSQSIFHFLAWSISGLSESLPPFGSVSFL
jgi:superfamily II RNA helicase